MIPLILQIMVAATSFRSFHSIPSPLLNATSSTSETILSIRSDSNDSKSTVTLVSDPLPDWSKQRKASKQTDQLCCSISIHSATISADDDDPNAWPSLLIPKCSSVSRTGRSLYLTLKTNVLPQIWTWIEGSSRLLTCHNGTFALNRSEGEDEKVKRRDRSPNRHHSHESRRQSNFPGAGRQRQEADGSEQQFLVPHVVHPINCANKTLPNDQRNGSEIMDPIDHLRHEGRVQQRRRTWNIFFLFEYEPVMAVSGRTLITIRAPHQKLKLRCKVFASPQALIRWERLSASQERLPLHSYTPDPESNITSNASALWFRSSTEHGSCWSLSTLELVIERPEDLGTYICSASNSHGSAITSFSIRANSGKIFTAREFNVTAFVSGMIPPVAVCIVFIMKLGYRSRYASTAAEEEALEEERIAYETNNINIFT